MKMTGDIELQLRTNLQLVLKKPNGPREPFWVAGMALAPVTNTSFHGAVQAALLVYTLS